MKWQSEEKKANTGKNPKKTLLPQLSCPVSRFPCYCLAFAASLFYFTLLLYSARIHYTHKGCSRKMNGKWLENVGPTLLHPGAQQPYSAR